MEVIADLQLHSKYARAVSPQMVLPNMAQWGIKKGMHLLGTGDFTHPLWLSHLKENLEEEVPGIFRLKDKANQGIRFMLTSEVSCIFSHKGRRKGVHLMVFLPGFGEVEKFNSQLSKRGAKLESDGRPIIGISCRDLVEIALFSSNMALVIPAHSFTPWFGVYGANGGFDSLLDAFGDMEKYIYGIETGMSADPGMCWGIPELEDRTILSFSDAHSPMKMGREATVFTTESRDLEMFTFVDLWKILTRSGSDWKIGKTLEFYPEEGKYYFTGHRNCKVKLSPKETERLGSICSVCGRQLTIGVAHQIDKLSDNNVEVVTTIDKDGIKTYKDARGKRPEYIRLVQLWEVVVEALNVPVSSKAQKPKLIYETLVKELKSEINVLARASMEEISVIAGDRIAEGIARMRKGDIFIDPGFDGVYGTVKIWKESFPQQQAEQLTFSES
jgi:uncharacterized protein (TIGR00375 family)